MSKIENIYDHPNYYSLEDFDGEVWKNIPNAHPQYFVSNLGRIKSVGAERLNRWGGRYMTVERILKTNTVSNGYQRVSIETKGYNIHKAVSLAFLGPRPTAKHQVNHKNGIKKDNRPDNLEWVTSKENVRHAWETGLSNSVRGIDRWLSFQVAQYQNGTLVAVHTSLREAERAANLARSCMSRVINGKRKQAGGFMWKKITKEEYFSLKIDLSKSQSKSIAHPT